VLFRSKTGLLERKPGTLDGVVHIWVRSSKSA
jgi:hypothetical protein